jgi:hypothetical protein
VVGVPFSTFGLAVKARKDTSEKGTPTIKTSLAAASVVHNRAATINRQRPLNGQINWLAAAFIFALRIFARQFHFQVVVSPQVYVIRRTLLRKFAQLQISSPKITPISFVSFK